MDNRKGGIGTLILVVLVIAAVIGGGIWVKDLISGAPHEEGTQGGASDSLIYTSKNSREL